MSRFAVEVKNEGGRWTSASTGFLTRDEAWDWIAEQRRFGEVKNDQLCRVIPDERKVRNADE